MRLEKLEIPTRIVNALNKKNIFTTRSVLEWGPRKYIAYSQPETAIQKHIDGDNVAIAAFQWSVTKKKMRNQNRHYLTFTFSGVNNGINFRIMMFNNVYLLSEYQKNNNKRIVICGRVRVNEYGWSMDNIVAMIPASQYEPFIHTIYPQTKGVGSEKLREIREQYLSMQSEIVEKPVLEKAGVIDYPKALEIIHNPTSTKDLEEAKKRLLFNDLLYFNILLKKSTQEVPTTTKKEFSKWDKTKKFTEKLPYQLTEGDGSQKAALNLIFNNAKKGKRNNILLQGDVGCGKTIIAISLMMYACENGYQSVLMSPREVLAQQHYNEISQYAEEEGISCILLHTDMSAKEKKEALEKIKSGEIQCIVGTHNCISEGIIYNNIGAVITDEEHLFGVKQKEALIEKAKDGVHVLSMSATPIPRTMFLALYGEQKEIFIIKKKPQGRLPIITSRISKREEAFEIMNEQIANNRQCCVVCPAIEDSEKIDLVSLEAVESVYKKYFKTKGVKVGVINGKMKKEEIRETVKAFTNNECQILLSTTVIEVGVNVPNSTVMVIEQAERFGLASLHQLRGRVGRSVFQSYCLLICDNPDNERIKIMCKTSDGFKIAEDDLRQRKSGDLIGTAQSGLNTYVDKMLNNPEIFDKTREIATFCIENSYGNRLLAEYEEAKTI